MRWAEFIVEKYRLLTNLMGTILLSWFLSAVAAEGIAMLIPSKAPSLTLASTSPSSFESALNMDFATTSIEDYKIICQRNIFDSTKSSPCERAPEIVTDEEDEIKKVDLSNEPPRKTDMAIQLLGTMVSTRKTSSFATITPKGGAKPESSNYYIGEKIEGEAEIYDIQRNIVYFFRDGRREYVEVENLPKVYASNRIAPEEPVAADSGVVRAGDEVKVTRSFVEEQLGNLNNVITQARMVPHFKDGKVDGFKIFAIRRGSIFEKLGLKNGDIIQRINGTTIDSVDKALPMMQLARNEDRITIDLMRSGGKKSVSIQIQ